MGILGQKGCVFLEERDQYSKCLSVDDLCSIEWGRKGVNSATRDNGSEKSLSTSGRINGNFFPFSHTHKSAFCV